MAFLIAVVAVAVAAVLADRLAYLAVSRLVAGRIALATQPAARPVIRISGFPFLTQLLAGRYRQVSVTLGTFTTAGVDFTGVTAQLADVSAPPRRLRPGTRQLMAGRVVATATIPMRALRDRLPPGLALRQDRGELSVTGSLLPMPVSGVLRIDAGRHAIRLTPRVLGMPSLIAFEIALPALPPQLAIESVIASEAGLHVRLGGADVLLSG